MPVRVAVRSRAWDCRGSLAGIAGSNPSGDIYICRECCVLSGRGFCDELITRPEGSAECRVYECDREASMVR